MAALRTIAYIDGYNLYYSALTGSCYKWLDLRALVSRLLIDSYIGAPSRLEAVKFFTAPVLGRYAKDAASPERQMRYHNALKFAPSGSVEVIEGFHAKETKKAFDVTARHMTRVELLEEKQTDVNIALHMYRDAALERLDHSVLISNDSDLAPVVNMLARDYPNILRGVVFPTLRERLPARQSGQLRQAAHWTRRSLNTEDLAACQLPRSIRNRRGKALVRPDDW